MTTGYTKDVLIPLRMIQNDERVDFHARATAELATYEIERLRDLAASLMAHMDQLPIKHPQQGERRNELRQQFDALVGHQQNAGAK